MSSILAYADSTSGAEAGLAIGVILVFALIGLAVLAWYIWLLVDMLKYPDTAWMQSAQNKQLWIILWVLGFCIGGSIIIGLIYQFAIRPKVRQAAGIV